MSYPDDFNQKRFDASQATPARDCPMAMRELERVHAVYTDVLNALSESCKKNRVLPSYLDFQAIMEVVGESLADEASAALSSLRDAGFEDFSYTPENHGKLIALAYDQVASTIRLRQVHTNPASHFQTVANCPVGVKCGDSAQLINRE